MELIITLDKLSKIDLYRDFDSFLIVNQDFSAFHKFGLSSSSTKTAIKKLHALNKKAYVLLDRLFFNEELVKLDSYIDELEKLACDGYFFSDLGFLKLLKNKNLVNKGIYYSQTQIVSSLELSAYLDEGLSGIFVSKDYPLNNLKTCLTKYDSVGINIYGYRNLFYSRRKLLSAYQDEYELKGKFNKSDAYLIREQKRTTKSIIYEDDFGTYVFTDYIDSHLSEIEDFKNAKYLLIDDNFIEAEYMVKVLDFIHKSETKYELNELEKDTYER